MSKIKSRYRFIVLLSMLTGIVSYAQEDIDEPTTKFKEIQLDEVVVTGTGTAHFMKHAPVLTEVITAKDLAKYSGSTIEEILSALSSSITINPGDMGSNIQLNGLKNDYILVLIDGRRINGDVGGQNDLSIISPAAIERIEIVKGASSSLYGSDAIGGVINIITKKSHDKFNFSSSTRVGGYGNFLQTLLMGMTHGKLTSNTSLTFKHTDGWQNTTNEWDHHEVKDGSVSKTVNRANNYSIAQSFEYRVNPDFGISADASFYEKRIYRPTGQWKFYLHDYFYRNQDYGVGMKWRLSDRNQITFNSAYGIYNYFFDYTGEETTNFFSEKGRRIVHYPGDRVLQTAQERWLNHLKGVFYIGDHHILSTGLEYQHDAMQAPYRLSSGKRSAYTLAAYAQEEWSVSEHFNVTGGVRYVYHKAFGSKITPKLSAMCVLGNLTLRGTYSMGFKTPTIKELYQNYITSIMGPLKAYYGNENLRPQSSHYGSLGIEYRTEKLRMNATGHYNSISDMIALTVVPTSPQDKLMEVEETMKYHNLAHGRTYGVDASLTWDILPSLALETGYSYTNAKAQYTDDPKDENYMKYLPMNATSFHNVTCRLTWSKKDLDISLFGRGQSTKYYITNGNGAGYTMWRINVHDRLVKAKGWTLDANAGVDNIFNYVDRTPFGRNRGTTNPGRTLFVNVLVKFQNNKDKRH